MADAESEFQGYTGGCVWTAVHTAAHRIDAVRYPLPDRGTLNWFISQAIAAGIGVGSQGQADPGQLETMLDRWGFRWARLWPFDGNPIPRADIVRILDAWLSTDYGLPSGVGLPVLMGFMNGQALTGDEVGLHGHEVAGIRKYDAARGGYGCADGDNPICATGALVYYSADQLAAAQMDSMYALERVPTVPLTAISIDMSMPQVAQYFSANADGSWTCKENGTKLETGMLENYRSMPALGTLAGLTALGLPLGNMEYQPEGNCGLQRHERGVHVWDPQRKLDNPAGSVGDYYLAHTNFRAPAAPAPTLHVRQNGLAVATVEDNRVTVMVPIEPTT